MPASARCSRFVVRPATSTLVFEARSTLHPVRGSGQQLSGFVDAFWNDRDLALDPAPAMHVEFPVESLRSGNERQDREMWKLMDSKRSPRIAADLRELRATAQAGHYTASGDITFAGRTRKYDGEMAIVFDGENVTVDGELLLDIRHFGLQPPRLLIITVAPEVKVRLHLVAALAAA